MRVLFVDDEPLILSGIENALLFADYGWETVFANSGEEAVTCLKEAPFGVLVTDMKMPGMSGADVLSHARDNYPAMVRIVLSGECDPELAQRAMPLAHEFVSKPCDPDDLFEIINRAHETSKSLDSPRIAELVGSLDTLPIQPRVFSEIQDCVSSDEGLPAITKVVESDVAIATAVIRMANSAFYGFGHETTTVRDAVSRLGSDTVSGIAMNAELAACTSPSLLQDLENLNGLSAHVASIVRKMIGVEAAKASLASLVRSIGVVVFITCVGEEYQPIQEHFRATGLPDDEGELRLFGATHSEVGAYVLRMWKVDPIVVEAVHYHREPSLASPEAQRIIHVMAAADAAISPDRPTPTWLDATLVDQARTIVEEASR